MSIAAAKNCVNVRAMQLAATIDQTKIGMRIRLIPGARMKMTVTRKLRPPRIDERPKVMIARLKNIWPWAFVVLSGAYAVQPESQPPNACADSSRMATGGTSQNESALRRGNAMSSAPIISGTK